MYMGMEMTGIPRIPWDSHGYGSDIEYVMGTGMGTGIKVWEWDYNHGNENDFPHLLSTKPTSCDSVSAIK